MTRPDHDQAGFGLFGVSRGGSTALVVGSEEPDVWGVVTDGAFPTRGTITAYILRWAEIFVRSRLLLALFPGWVYSFLGWVSLLDSQRRLNCRFPDIETAARRLSPRPWLLIHGERDAYIGPEIAKSLFDHAREPKEMWLVPAAKHNRCRECEPEAYAARITEFLGQHAPRRPGHGGRRRVSRMRLCRLYSAEPGRPVRFSRRLVPERRRPRSRAESRLPDHYRRHVADHQVVLRQPVVNRARRLARAFLDQTLHGRRRPAPVAA